MPKLYEDMGGFSPGTHHPLLNVPKTVWNATLTTISYCRTHILKAIALPVCILRYQTSTQDGLREAGSETQRIEDKGTSHKCNAQSPLASCIHMICLRVRTPITHRPSASILDCRTHITPSRRRSYNSRPTTDATREPDSPKSLLSVSTVETTL